MATSPNDIPAEMPENPPPDADMPAIPPAGPVPEPGGDPWTEGP